jgi:membrane fusion protein (multidrug efflux system)
MNHPTRRAAARPGRASRPAVTAPSDDPAPAVGRRVFTGLALGAALLLAACGKEAAPPAAARAPAEVGVVTLQRERLDFQAELPGRTSARLAAEVRPQVGGLVRRRLFEEGAQVKAGQVLYELEPASLQASLASANAAVRKAEATLASATTTAKRQAELRRIDAISQQDEIGRAHV